MSRVAISLACLAFVASARRVNRGHGQTNQRLGSLASLLFMRYPSITPRPRSQSRGREVFASLPEWAELERSLPSLRADGPMVCSDSEKNGLDFEGKTVLFRDSKSWCPYSERVWLALELKKAPYVTCLMDHDYSSLPGEKGSLPRVQWADGTINDGSEIRTILERIEKEHPHSPHFFPDVSASVAVVRNSFDRFDGIMPRFTLPSSTAPYVFACRVQRQGSFDVDVCEIGELVPRFKYEVCLEEIEEMLEEYDDGPFIAGSSVTAADIYWAPFLERLAAHLPLLYDKFVARGKSSGFEAIEAWFDAMDELVPCYSCRIKGSATLWQELLAKDPYLEGKLQDDVAFVSDLPTKKSFNVGKVWAAYSQGRPHVAATPSKEVAACIVRNRALIIDSCETTSLGVDDVEIALRELCNALVSNQTSTKVSDHAQTMASHLVSGCEGMYVPQDLGVIPAQVLQQYVE